MRKTLVLNGSHSELYLIRQAKQLGHFVVTTGNLPHASGHLEADLYIQADYSDQEAMLRIAREQKIDSVVSCANDFGAISASYIAEKMGLPGHDPYATTLMLHTKDAFKNFALANNMRVCPSVSFDTVEEALEYEPVWYPAIVKPVDLTGGKGVNRVNNLEEYRKAIRVAFDWSRKKRIVVEKFVVGTYHSFSTFLVDKHVIGSFCDNEYSYNYPYYVTTSAGPADRADDVRDILIAEAEKYAELLNLADGIFHMQYVMDQAGAPYVIDITRRTSGDLYAEPVEKATGLPWSKWTVMAECGGYPRSCFSERGTQRAYYGRHCLMAEHNGIVKGVWISDELKDNIYDQIEWWRPEYSITNYLTDKVGIAFWHFHSWEEMRDKIGRIHELIKVELTDTN